MDSYTKYHYYGLRDLCFAKFEESGESQRDIIKTFAMDNVLNRVGFTCDEDIEMDTIITTEENISISYLWPFEVAVVKGYISEDGWTRGKLCETIQREYMSICAEEEAAIRLENSGYTLDEIYLRSVDLCSDGIVYLNIDA